jgi:hypothetical protein
MQNVQLTPRGNWSDWKALSGEKIAPRFTVEQYKDGHLVIFGVSAVASKHLWNVTPQTCGEPYGDWKNMGKADIDQLAAGNGEDGCIQLFGMGKDKRYLVRPAMLTFGRTIRLGQAWQKRCQFLLN